MSAKDPKLKRAGVTGYNKPKRGTDQAVISSVLNTGHIKLSGNSLVGG